MLRLIGRPLAFLAARAPWCLAVGIALGLGVPPLASTLRPAISGTVVILLVAAFLRIDTKELRRHIAAPLLPVALALALLGATPLAIHFATLALPLTEGLCAALVLMGGAAPITSATAFALLLGLDAPLALAVGAAALALVPLTVPTLAFHLLELELAIGPSALALRLATIIGGAAAIAAMLRRITRPGTLRDLKPQIDGVAVIALMVFAIGVMDGVTAEFLRRPSLVLGYVAAAFIANLGLQAIAALCAMRLGRRRALTIALSAGNRNMGMILAALPLSTDSGITLFFAVGQLPIYLLPVLLLPVYRRLLPVPAEV